MKSMGTWITTLALALGMTAGTALAGPLTSKRQVNQQRRIGQGVRSGELTKREVRGLQVGAARTHRSIRRDRIDGGVFTPKERVQSHRKLNRQSRRIAKQKNDGQARN